MTEILHRLKATQCCDPAIDGLLGAAIKEIERLNLAVAELRMSVANQAGDTLCWLTSENPAGYQIPPWPEFSESCLRFHAQISSQYGVLLGAKTIAQLEADNAEYEASFELRWKADMRAIERWRAGHPERRLVMPDHADLCCWLLEQID